MAAVPEALSKKWLFWLQMVLDTGQACQTFFKKTLKWKDVSAWTIPNMSWLLYISLTIVLFA